MNDRSSSLSFFSSPSVHLPPAVGWGYRGGGVLSVWRETHSCCPAKHVKAHVREPAGITCSHTAHKITIQITLGYLSLFVCAKQHWCSLTKMHVSPPPSQSQTSQEVKPPWRLREKISAVNHENRRRGSYDHQREML